MKVRLLAVGEMGVRPETAEWLTLQREYLVLAIEIGRPEGIRYRVLTDTGQDGLFAADLFEITDPTASSRWSVAAGPGDSLTIAPASWLREDFWTEYWDDLSDRSAGARDNLRAGREFRGEVEAMFREQADRDSTLRGK